MVRITIIEIASFLLPFLIFLIWRWQSNHDSLSRPTPVLRLTVIGGLFSIVMLIGLIVMDSLGSGHAGDQYVPPRLVDGEIQPGYFIPADEAEPETEVTDDPQ